MYGARETRKKDLNSSRATEKVERIGRVPAELLSYGKRLLDAGPAQLSKLVKDLAALAVVFLLGNQILLAQALEAP